MKSHQLQSIPFHTDTVYLVEHDGQPYTPVKPICENIGVAWQPQHAKLSEESERWSCHIIVTTGADGKKYKMLCLPLFRINSWLLSISAAKVKPEVREQLIRYQDECDKALWDYWTRGVAVNPRVDIDKIMRIITLLSKANYQGKFFENLIKYRKMGLNYSETGRVLGVSKETVKSYEALAKEAGLVEEVEK